MLLAKNPPLRLLRETKKHRHHHCRPTTATTAAAVISSRSAGSATIGNGHALLNNCLRSLLSHKLALPLFHALHGNDPGQQTYLAKKSLAFAKEENGHDFGDTIFKEAVKGWVKQWKDQTMEPKKKRTERQLTESLNELIDGAFQKTYFHSHCEVEVKRTKIYSPLEPNSGRIDILLSSLPNKNDESPSTPLAVIEVGRKNNEWMKKLDQAGKCLDIMRDKGMKKELKFQNAMLFAILTLESEENTQKSKFQSQFGVFLCWPNSGNGFRMTLLWSAHASNLTTASDDFGRFLRVVASFAVWRNDDSIDGYHYLSSNVCCVDTTVSWLPRICCWTPWGLFEITLLTMSSCFHFAHICAVIDTSELRHSCSGDRTVF